MRLPYKAPARGHEARREEGFVMGKALGIHVHSRTQHKIQGLLQDTRSHNEATTLPDTSGGAIRIMKLTYQLCAVGEKPRPIA
jgi:hypothetical protein